MFLLAVLQAGPADAGQLGSLLSPGPLARAHQTVEGAQCQQCHEAGRKVSAVRCLNCHRPVAERMAAKKGAPGSSIGACGPVKCPKSCVAISGPMIGNTRSFSPAAKPVTGLTLPGRRPWMVIAATERYERWSWRIA